MFKPMTHATVCYKLNANNAEGRVATPRDGVLRGKLRAFQNLAYVSRRDLLGRVPERVQRFEVRISQ
jgi:hypothetical protein